MQTGGRPVSPERNFGAASLMTTKLCEFSALESDLIYLHPLGVHRLSYDAIFSTLSVHAF